MRGAPAGVKVRGGTDIAAPRRGVMHVNFGPPREDCTMKNMGERLPLFRSFRMTGFDGADQFVLAPEASTCAP